MSEELNNIENEETSTTEATESNDFFESTLNIDDETYDYKVAFDLIDRMYKEGKEYEVHLSKYKSYQKGISTLSDEERAEITKDERYPEIQEKLKWIEKFDTNNL